MTRAAIARMPAASSAGRTAAVFSARRTGQAVAQFFFTAPDHGLISYDHHDTGRYRTQGCLVHGEPLISRANPLAWLPPQPDHGSCAFWSQGTAVTWVPR